MLKAGGRKIFVSLFILFLQTVLYCANTENVWFFLRKKKKRNSLCRVGNKPQKNKEA